MALTATSTIKTFTVVSDHLSMVKPKLIALPPYRDNNIVYRVKEKIDMDKFVDEFANELGTKRMNFPKTIVYVRTYTDCYKIYSLMRKKLGLAFTDPPGYPNIAGYRLADMFSRVQTAEKREEVFS